MGLEFQIRDSKVSYTPLKDKWEAIRNLESPKTLKQTRAFVEWLISCIIPTQSTMPTNSYLRPTKEIQKV